jgi:hypothetical protein
MDGICSTQEDIRNLYITLVANPEGRRTLESQDVDEKIILDWILDK